MIFTEWSLVPHQATQVELPDELDAILTAIEHPKRHEQEPRPGLERFDRCHITDRLRWLRWA